MGKWKAIEFNLGEIGKYSDVGWLETLWGLDVFIGSVPMFKTMVFANVIVWLLLFGKHI